MADEQVILKNTYIKYISPVPDIQDKKNESSWKPGFIAFTNKRILLMPEKNNQPAEKEAISLDFSQIVDVDRKIDLWKKIMGTAKILPIHHIANNKEVISLISTSDENTTLFKKVLFVLLTAGTSVEFVCPFSQGGKILLDKQPIKGVVHIKENLIVLVSEWLGRKQQEIIDIEKLDDFQKGESNGSGQGRSSLKLTYIKDNVLISTLITSENKITLFLDKYIKIFRGITDKEIQIKLTEQQFMLLQMMYSSDIDAQMAQEMLGVSGDELDKIVRVLVQENLLKISGSEEVELTEKGTKYIVGQMKKNIGGS